MQVPESSSLTHVMPYLLKLAISDPQLYWRLGTALVAMILSKSAGTMLVYLAHCACYVLQLLILYATMTRSGKACFKHATGHVDQWC